MVKMINFMFYIYFTILLKKWKRINESDQYPKCTSYRFFFFSLPIPVPLVYLDWDVYMFEHYLCFFTITEAWARDWLIVSPHTRWYLDEGIRWEVHSNRIRILWSSPFRGSRQGVRKRCTCDKRLLGRRGRLESEDLVGNPVSIPGGTVCTSHVTSGTSVLRPVRCRVGKGDGGKG